VVLFVEHVWNLKRPELVLSITGSAEEFSMGEDREKVLYQLMETARCSNGWIVTGGTCAGIMKYVGNLP
jgi:transient receptor potential cation channel subfamily M member 2